MHFVLFDLEASTDCQYDYMEIGTAVRLCGTLNQKTDRIYSFDRDEIEIRFHSDATNEQKGFQIKIEQLECDGDRIIRNARHPQDDDLIVDDDRSKDYLLPQKDPKRLEQFKLEQREQFIQQQRFETQADFLPNKKHLESLDLLQKSKQKQSFEDQRHLPQQRKLSKFEPSSSAITDLEPSQTDSSCSRTFMEMEFFIQSPGFPQNYPLEMDCLYLIVPASNDVCRLEINFDSFELQPFDFEKNCLKSDYIDFNNQEQFCGKILSSERKSYKFLPNETFFIHFHSDSFRTSFDRGFRLFLRQIECSFASDRSHQTKSSSQLPQTPSLFRSKSNQQVQFDTIDQSSNHQCSRIFMNPVFEIRSPRYPQFYPPNSYCHYQIVKFKTPGLNVCFLEIQFIEFELQPTVSDCANDYVSFNGVKVCGSQPANSVRLFPFYENEFSISFFSDSKIENRGFWLRVRQNECPSSGQESTPDLRNQNYLQKTNKSDNLKYRNENEDHTYQHQQITKANQQCQRIISSENFELKSPNYPNYYLPGLNCLFIVEKIRRNYCKLELFIIDFDLESSIECAEDFVLIDDVRYCNSNRPKSILQLPFYEQTKRIYFQTSNFRPRKGFRLQGRQIDCLKNDFYTGLTKNIGHQQNDSQQKSLDLLEPNNYGNNFNLFLPQLPSICEICVTEVTGQIQSYDYPNFYPPNLNCTYRITPLPNNCMVELRFDQFEFDFTPECNQDYLEINSIRYCGQQLKDVSSKYYAIFSIVLIELKIS